jgi:hypothetical protein
VEGGAAGFAGNTGYGLGDTATVAYSEKLQALFAQRRDGTMTAGQALEFAKDEYVGQLGVIGPYDAKAVNESTFYGLPMWKIGTGTPPVPAPNPPTTTDADTGLQSLGFDVSPTLTAVPKSNGTYYTSAAPTSVNGYQATNRRPIEPLSTVDVTEPGLVAHGAVLTGLTSNDVSPFTAAFSRVVDDSSSSEPPLGGVVDFPARLQSLATVATPAGERQRLVLIEGQFRSAAAGGNSGTQRLFRRQQGKVLYSTSNDFTPPAITHVQVLSISSGTVAFAADVSDDASGVAQALVLYNDGGSTWKSAALGCANGHCTGGGPFAGGQVDYFLQAADGAGNVGISSGKAFASSVTLPHSTGTITITPSAQPNASGWYVDPPSPITLTATGPDGVALSFSIDGADFQPVNGSFPAQGVSGNGIHTVEVKGVDGSDAFTSIAIDSAAPVIKITTPADGAVFLAGDVFKSDFTCSDAGSGLAANGCTGPASVDTTLPTGSTGTTKTFTVTAKDVAGHTTTKSVSYNVWRWTGFFSPVNNLPVINSVNAGQAIPIKFSLGGNRGLSIFAAGYPRSQQIPCDPNATVDGVDQILTAGSSSLSFDAGSNQYTYVWKTDKSWTGQCRQLVLRFPSGSSRRADFKFK